jgi:hypothetical protein
MRNSKICTKHKILCGKSNKGSRDGQGMWHELERKESRAKKPERNRSIGTPRLKLEHNIRMGLKEIGWEGVA